MPILGIDYGEKKVGLAISDDKAKMALPLNIVSNQGDNNLVQEIKKICQEHEINKVVVGLPLTLATLKRDFQNEHTKKILKFITLLKDSQKELEVLTEDERFTSRMANNLHKGIIKNKGQDDAVAAMLILQSYLDKNQK